jgi:hypothetical protein
VTDMKKALIKFLVLLAAAPLAVMWSAYVLTVLWGWFVVPVFYIAPLGIEYAAGLGVLVSFLTHQAHSHHRKASESIAIAIGHPMFALGFGWVITLFI